MSDASAGPQVWYDYAPSIGANLPLVILLHGAGRDGLSLIEMWSEAAKRHGIALLAPDAGKQGWPLQNPDAAVLQQLINEMSERHNIDPERIFLFGHSNGAAYAQVLLNRTTGPWRAAVLHAGFVPSDMLVQPATPKPFRLYIGEHEHIFSIEDAKTNGRELAKRGHDNDIVIIPGHTHWLYEAGPRIAEKSWTWFLREARLGARSIVPKGCG
ncbi:prolyl oligopeptidase family serine peptidase [Roseovarius sp. 2305UL8-3]|uniref:prolyl oligopeptidase family serine peptidase n=1 Tax=Roseovarius conchicola TaxID=3121636 RepID=UPI003527E428